MSTKKKTTKQQNVTELLLGFGLIILFNIIGGYLFFRLDLTSEKRYSLSLPTKELLKNLDDMVFVKVYLEGDFPAGFKRLRNETKEMLNEFRAYTKYIEYEFINPSESSDKATRKSVYGQLMKKGLEPTNLQVKEGEGTSQKLIFPGAIIRYKNREVPVQLLKSQVGASSEEVLNNSVRQLEYEFINAVRKLSVGIKPKIAFIHGHGELDHFETADIDTALSEYYDVAHLVISGKLDALDGYKAIIIAKPDSIISEKDKYIIDQFIMRGGNVLWFIDPVYASMDSLRATSQSIAFAFPLNIEDQLFRYGVRINTNLAQDMQACPIPVVTGYLDKQPQYALVPWLFFPLVGPANNHPIVNNINYVKTEFTSTIDTIAVPRVKKTILLKTSNYTKLINTPARISLDILKKQPDERQFHQPNQAVAVLLEGNFESVYKNRLLDNLIDSLKVLKRDYVERSVNAKMIVVSDGDIIKNQLRQTPSGNYIPLPLGYDKYSGQTFGNKNFVLNAVNYMCDDSKLIAVRSRELKLRLLDAARISKQRFFWQVLNIALPIFLIIIFGIILNYLRKKRFSN